MSLFFFIQFQNEYLLLADQLSDYAVKLLDKVRGHAELDCLLGKTGKEVEEKYVVLARLYLAIQYEEKPVRQFDRKGNILENVSFSFVLVRRAFELSAKTSRNLAQSNPNGFQVELVDSSAINYSLHFRSTVRLFVLRFDVVVKTYCQSKSSNRE